MASFINIKTEGIRGNGFSKTENKGSIGIIIDDTKNRISIDAFSGSGESYKRRTKALINIVIGENIFSGTIDELNEKLFKK